MKCPLLPVVPHSTIAPLPLASDRALARISRLSSPPLPFQDASSSSAATRRKPAKGKGVSKGTPAQRKERSRYERYCDVEAFWKSLPPEGRRQLLRVPVKSLLHGACACGEAEARQGIGL